ncbi:MAG: hypothetical protein KDJ20_14935, partial [Hyphomicrobiales bacterium]|nr:hypothetical protein [Hyphomicrobiales bacterium]
MKEIVISDGSSRPDFINILHPEEASKTPSRRMFAAAILRGAILRIAPQDEGAGLSEKRHRQPFGGER